MKSRTVKWPIKVWFVFHAIMITLWSLPKAAPPFRIFNDTRATPAMLARAPQPGPIDRFYLWNDRTVRAGFMGNYLIVPGFWQYWDMFSPNPSPTDCYLRYEIIYSDGTDETKDFYRIYTMSAWDKYRHERFRKFVERLIPENAYYLWPTVAKRLAVEAYARRGVMPSRVRLLLYTRNAVYMKPKPDYRIIEFYQHVVIPKEVLGVQYR